ncbi:MAG: hypothetical protein C7B47_17245 [Sulfobacillus thermosulfidooxidans]|uniref:Uncharacterized protein n=1 Tax=Sulfobacillus thermosulfidooxidans TaxID=28034 RepID=A0A2T2WH38_SULTH|nr:MAG: hypothetical protein C7B47_17245 [Sulfobacillus thermosulfidooxidans]
MKHNRKPIASSIPRLVLLVGGLALNMGFVGGVAFAKGGNFSGSNGVNPTPTPGPTLKQIHHRVTQQLGTSSQSPYDTGTCGTGVLSLTPTGETGSLGIANGGCPPPPGTSGGGGSPPGHNTTRLIASQNTAVPLTPYYFNGCEPRPALTTVQNGPHFVVAPGAGTAITPPTPNTVAMGTEPQLSPGAVFSGQLTSAPALWDAMQNEQATGQVLPGPMWGVVSQEWQNETINTYQTVNAQGQVVNTFTQTVKDGPPYWVANESYNINSCPVPAPDFTP